MRCISLEQSVGYYKLRSTGEEGCVDVFLDFCELVEFTDYDKFDFHEEKLH